MTKFQILSDLHSEFFPYYSQPQLEKLIATLNPNKEDRIALVAGDLTTRNGNSFVYDLLADRFTKVISVMGNHDYWSGRMHPDAELDDLRRDTSYLSNVHILENQSIEINDTRVHGCTGWFPNRPDNSRFEREFPDFWKIQKFKPWAYQRNEESKEFLYNNVKLGDIVLMHHIPLQALVAPRWQNNNFTRFFVADFEELPQTSPSLIVYGHTHNSHDEQAGGIRYVCNPHGYYMADLNREFRKDLIVTLNNQADASGGSQRPSIL